MTDSFNRDPAGSALLPSDYPQLLIEIARRFETARVKAALSVNRELIDLYLDIDRMIVQRQQTAGWGGKVIDRLRRDRNQAFPEMKGFSVRNLKYMRKFAEQWPDAAIVQEVLAQISWYHRTRSRRRTR